MKAKQKASEAAAFRDDHFELFRLAGFEWPVQVGSLRGAYYRIPPADSIGERVFEEVVFLDRAFSPAAPVEFVDVNSSLPWHLGWKLGGGAETFERAMKSSPWSPFPRTLVSRSIVLMRVCDSHVRILEAWEHMALAGWSLRNFNSDRPIASHDVLTSMAGNAFSGFAIAPVCIAAIAVAGLPKVDPSVEVDSSSDAEDCFLTDDA